MVNRIIKILLIDDDEEDYIITRELISEIEFGRYELEWVDSYHIGLEKIMLDNHDVYLLDYRLSGTSNGLQLLKEAIEKGCKKPIILLTGQQTLEIDIEAMKAGAVDFLDKGQVTSQLLERSIRYGIEHKMTLEALRESEERYELAVRGANDGLWDWNLINNEIYYSPRWKEILGFEGEEISANPDEWFERVHPQDIIGLIDKIEAHKLGHSSHFESEHRIRHKKLGYIWVLSRGLAIQNNQQKPYRMAGSMTDITDRKVFEEKLFHVAIHDDLTGLFNRRHLRDVLKREIHSAKRHKFQISLCLCDLDNFKEVNDNYGHNIGDKVLLEFGNAIKSVIRPEDIAGRYGGDEFCIIFTHTLASDAAYPIGRIAKIFKNKQIEVENHVKFTSSATFGIVDLQLNEDVTESEFIQLADQSLYAGKELGRNCIVVNGKCWKSFK